MKTKMKMLAALALLALPAAVQGQDPASVASGAQVWANQCVRCHNARPSVERTDAQWVVIVSHMRARANLTRSDARVVTAFLQATNLPEIPMAPPELPRESTPAAEPKDARPQGGASGVLAPELWAAVLRYLRTIPTR